MNCRLCVVKTLQNLEKFQCCCLNFGDNNRFSEQTCQVFRLLMCHPAGVW